MAAEIKEQPEAWERLLAEGRKQIAKAAEKITRSNPSSVFFAARGTSDHAALYGKYMVEITHGLPAGLISPSTMSVYGARPNFRHALVVAVSQSGGSPDLLETLKTARERGAVTLAITNNPASALARSAEISIDIMAGPEQAVAATKSYTSQLLAIYLLLEALRGDADAAARKMPELAATVLGQESLVVNLAHRLRFAQKIVSTGRGYSYPTARECAIKLMETSYTGALAFSGADLMHGPLAMVDADVPVLAVAAEGRGGNAMHKILASIKATDAETFCVGTSGSVAIAGSGIVLPSGVPEELSPLLEILPFQQLALHLATTRGKDPDRPRGLQKVTATL
jgi:glucosamine--fructose-6-phosphate aminotransferase (isomerizing)